MATSNNGISILSLIESKAHAVAEKLDHNSALTYHMSEFFDASDVVKRGSLVVYKDITATFTAEELDGFPEPDTTREYEENGEKKTRNNFAVIETVDQNNKKIRIDFYKVVAESTKQGKNLNQDLTWWRGARDGVADPEIPQEYMHAGLDVIQGKIQQVANRVNNYRNLIKKAVNIHLQFKAIREAMGEHVYVNWVLTKKPIQVELPDGTAETRMMEEIDDSPACIKVAEKTSEGFGKSTRVTIGTFLGYDVKRAIEKGGNYDALILSGRKEKAPTGNKTADKTLAKRIENPAQFDEYVAELAAFLQTKSGKAQLLNYLNDLEKRNEADDFLISFGDLVMELDSWFTKRQSKYEGLKEKPVETKQAVNA